MTIIDNAYPNRLTSLPWWTEVVDQPRDDQDQDDNPSKPFAEISSSACASSTSDSEIFH